MASAISAQDRELVDTDPAFRNHLAFLAAHRGRISMSETGVGLDGAAPFLSFFSPLSATAEVPARCETVWLYPWSGAGWPERLGKSGFAAAEQLITMQLAQPPALGRRPTCTIERVHTRSAAIAFADVQARGFLNAESDHRQWWIDCFRKMALRNIAAPDQDFLLARAAGEAVAVLLTVRTGSTAGIYAVTTAPEHRGQGFSTALLHRAVALASAEGSTAIILQVAAGSYAHGFYQRLGFVDDYACQVWRR